MRGWVQEILPLWMVWELAERPEDLRDLLRATLAGSWLLAILTVANLAAMDASAAGQARFVAAGQDPNDVARFLVLSFPLAVLLAASDRHWAGRLLAWGYLPLGLGAVLLTASRGGFLAALVALIGSSVVLLRRRPWMIAFAVGALPLFAGLLWSVVPRATFERLATIPEQLHGGDFNLRLNIWQAGWQAFKHAPFFGQGMGAFPAAAHLAPIDTAHNTVLSLAVGGGLVAVLLASCIVVAVLLALSHTGGNLRWTLAAGLLAWLVTSLVATVEENRTSWLLLGLIALAGRLAQECPSALRACFDPGQPAPRQAPGRRAA
jgi:O-antigen ligase